LLDVAGKDATNSFEDIGHSNDARKMLTSYLIGSLKLSAEEIKKIEEEAEAKAKGGSGGGGSGMMIAVVVILAALIAAYLATQK
jgi:cytochrome b involved in lipid metabolism